MGHGFWTEAIQSGPVPEQDRRFDAIVVGGGPGGAAAAARLALMGRSVLLIEKGVFPRDKVCGDAVGGKSLSHVADLGIKPQLEMTPHFRVTGILFGAPKGHTVRVPLPEEDVQRLEAGYALPASSSTGCSSIVQLRWCCSQEVRCSSRRRFEMCWSIMVA